MPSGDSATDAALLKLHHEFREHVCSAEHRDAVVGRFATTSPTKQPPVHHDTLWIQYLQFCHRIRTVVHTSVTDTLPHGIPYWMSVLSTQYRLLGPNTFRALLRLHQFTNNRLTEYSDLLRLSVQLQVELRQMHSSLCADPVANQLENDAIQFALDTCDGTYH
uniref:Calpain-like protease palB/RIM13 n=1 Tax=Lygus hesperus TaxID=30085 RepID=A0A0A9Y7A0_LYGHE